MKLKEGTKIKVLENVKCISPKNTILPKYEVVTVVKNIRNTFTVKDIIDEVYIVRDDFLYKIVGFDKKYQVKAEIQREGNQFKIKKANTKIPMAVQKIQTIASNILNTEDILTSNKLILAAICASLTTHDNLDDGQRSKLTAITNKLISNAN